MPSKQPGADLHDDDAEMKRGSFGRWVAKTIKNPGRVYQAVFYVVTMFFLFMMLFLFCWFLIIALMPNWLISDMGLPPKGSNPKVFVTMFECVPFHPYVFNSSVLGIMATAIVLLLVSLVGYVFGRLRFLGKDVLTLGILTISYFPPAAFLIPPFELFAGNTAISLGTVTAPSPGLSNTPAPMVSPFSALFLSPSIFILMTFYGQIPGRLGDATYVEGTTRLGVLFHVIMPLSAPGVAAAGVLTFILVHNESFFSFTMNNGETDSWALIVAGALKYQGQLDASYNLMAAAPVVGVLPMTILVIIAQGRIVSGLTVGALKE